MNRFVLSCCFVALTTGLAGCSNFKATDKLMRNDHKVIQNTRIHQQATKYTKVPVQMPSTITSSVTQLPAPIEVKTLPAVTVQAPTTVARTVVQQEVVQPVVTKTIVRQAPVATVKQINVRTLNRVRILELQRALAARGLYKAPIDGIFGMHTARGLATYQKSMGVSGPVTIQVLQGLGMFL